MSLPVIDPEGLSYVIQPLSDAIQPISRFIRMGSHTLHRMGSGTLQWAASKAHGLYKKSSYSTEVQELENPQAPAVGRGFPSQKYTSSPVSIEEFLVSIEERSSGLSLVVQGSPDIVSTRELDIPESPREQTPQVGFDNKQSGFDNDELDTSTTQLATELAIEPTTSEGDTNKYVTVGDFNRYLSQFKKMSLPDLQGDLDSRVKRQDLIGYIRSHLHVAPAIIAPDFVNENEYFTRQELVYLVAQLSLYFISFQGDDMEKDNTPLEMLRSPTIDRERLRVELLKKNQICKSKTDKSQDVPVKKAKPLDVPVKKAAEKNKSKNESNDSEQTQAKSQSGTRSHGGKEMMQEQGSSCEQSEVEFSKINEKDGAVTRRAKEIMELCDSYEIDPEKFERAGLPGSFATIRPTRVGTYLLVNKEQPLQAPGPGAGHSVSSQNETTPSFIED